MRFSICLIEPDNYRYSHFLYDLCKYLCYTIEAIGYECCMVKNNLYSDRINILLGAHNISDPHKAEEIKRSGKYIIIQSELLRKGGISGWPDQPSFHNVYIPLMKNAFAVWNGIPANDEFLQQYDIFAKLVPRYGYLPALEEVIHKKRKDIDFLHYGSLTPHRQNMINALIRRGGQVVCIFDEAAIFRNDYIARARINLAPIQAPGKNSLTSRITYLLNNRSIVAVERCHDQNWVEHCFPYADTEQWVDLCMEMIHRPNLEQLAEEYFEKYKQLDMTPLFRPLMDELQLQISASPHGHASDTLLLSKCGALDSALLTEFQTDKAIPGLTSIIMVTHNCLEYTKKCVKSIRKYTPEPYEIIFVNQDCSDETSNWLQSQIKINKNIRLAEGEKNYGFIRRRNQGIKMSRGEFVVLMDDDIVVSEHWLSGMLNCINFAPDAGIVGAMTNNGDGMQQAADESYQTVHYLDKYAAQYKERFRHRRISCRNLDGFCLLFKRTLAESIGLFDERFHQGQCEDEDFCIRATLAGYRNYIAGDVFLHRETQKAPCDRFPLEDKWTLTLGSSEGKKLALLKAVEYAELLHSKGKDDQAVEALVNCIKFTPDTKEIYYELARIFIESKKFSEAWEVVGTMPEEAKSSIKGLELAGYAREGLGLDNEAMDFADKILSSDRSNPSALNLKGILAFKKDQIGEAEDYFKRAIQSDPGFGEPYTNLGVLCWKMGKNEEALEHLRKGFILSPNVPDHCNIYYSVLSTSEEFRRAKDDYAEANRLYPHNKHIAFLYIDILIRQANLEKAMLKIEDALASFGPEEGLLNAALSVREKIGPRQIDPSLKRGTLSFCLIVKNEEKYLVNCLKSIRDIADEIVVVDTGSTDKTVDIAKVFGARLFFYPWIGDFSAARNRSLEEARGDWIFVLDADEVISSVDYEDLKAITGKRPASPAAYLVNTRNYLASEFVFGRYSYDGKYPEESRLGWISSGKVRLFTRREDVFFVNPVHELLEPSIINAKIPLYNCSIAVHHYGKMDSSKDAQKGEEYYLMGKIKCENEPNNVRYIIELAKQAQLLSKNEEALGLFRKALALLGDDRESPVFKDVSVFTFGDPIAELQAYVAASCLHLNRFEEALEASRKSMKTDVKLKEYITVYAQCEILAGSFAEALTLLEEQLQITPDYIPAIIFKAAVLCMEGKKEKLKELSPVMLQNRDHVTAVFNVLTMKLHQNHMRDQALRLAATAFDNQIITEDTHNILQLLDTKLSSQTCQ